MKEKKPKTLKVPKKIRKVTELFPELPANHPIYTRGFVIGGRRLSKAKSPASHHKKPKGTGKA